MRHLTKGMKMKHILFAIVLISTACSTTPKQAVVPAAPIALPTDPKEQRKDCESFREYVTTIEFLRDKNEVAMPEADAQKMALDVSKGCTGAANRFIKVTTLLSRSKISGKNAAQSGLKFVMKSDAEMQAFIEIFQKAYLKEFLDMDMMSSVDIAHSLSNDFTGDSTVATKDFNEIAAYCNASSVIKMRKQDCGALAGRIAKKGQNSKLSVAQEFKNQFEFLVSSDGPKLNINDAIKAAEDTVSISPKASKNFINAYKYAVAKEGLRQTSVQALSFAMQMANLTDSQYGQPAASAINKKN